MRLTIIPGSRHLAGFALLLVLCASTGQASEPASRRVPDTIAQRTEACTVCHGKEGVSTNTGYFPRIAGKPAGYLFNQLVNFREGRRNYQAMTHLLDHMSDAYLHEIADHFAQLQLPYPPPQTHFAPAQVLEQGKLLVLHGDGQRKIPACAKCHGAAMTGVMPAFPGLLGLPRDYLVGQLGAWKSGQRNAPAPDCMARIANQLTPEDVSAIATWLSAQPIPSRAGAATASAEKRPLECGSGQQ